MNAIEIEGLCKAYAGFKLEDVSFALPEGGIMGLVGENGAGKSTTIKLIMNAIPSDGGKVSVLGTDNLSPEFRAVKEDVGVVLDEAYFPEALCAADVGKIMRLTYARWSDSDFAGYVSRFALDIRKPFKDYSRGMKMKLAIAVALSHAPRLLVLDEATSGLDPMVRDEILEIFYEFAQKGGSVLLSSHIVSDLEKICDRIAFLHGGKLMFVEEKAKLLERYAVIRTTEEGLTALPEMAVRSVRRVGGTVEALVERAQLPQGVEASRATVEDVILHLAKEGK